MARYTIDVYTLLKDNNFKVFNFDYDFYTDDPNIKQAFETKFIDRYMFNEIGFETVSRFKHYLKERLNSIAPYYKQLYETELKSKDIQFLLNKDLKETFIRELEGENKSQNDNTTSTTSNTTSNTTNNTSSTTNESNNSTVNLKSNESNENTVNDSKTETLNSNFKESSLDNGNADIGLNNGNLTTVSNKTDSNSSNNEVTSTETKDNTVSSTNKNLLENSSNSSNTVEGVNNTTIDNRNNTTINNENKETETTTLISQGNIGVTSSAQLLKEWRSVLINIDNLIIEECKDLFMSIY